jgi:hypothetical protein
MSSSGSTLSSSVRLAPVTDEATGENDNAETNDSDTSEQVQVVEVHIPPDAMKGFSEKLKK